MEKFIYKEGYKSLLTKRQNEEAIRIIRDYFQNFLSEHLKLYRVTAPLFIETNSKLNDGLSGVEEPVRFALDGIDSQIEIVHSLAKWKRMNIAKYGFSMYEGLYTNMNAIRKDEIRDNIHSVYVDQWDYEKIIKREDRNLSFLYNFVKKIYRQIKILEDIIEERYLIKCNLPEKIKCISSEELLDLFPSLDPDSRVFEIVKKHKAVFVSGIGWKLKDGKAQDLRAPDYDDWNLNGDIYLYDEVLERPLEISSMGIRVDKESLINQLNNKGITDLDNKYYQAIINEEIPFTIGGGIGQSRLCMLLLKKLHIGEVQSSIWEEKTIQFFRDKGIDLL